MTERMPALGAEGWFSEEGGPALFFAQAQEVFVDMVAGHLVEGGEGFIEQQDSRACC